MAVAFQIQAGHIWRQREAEVLLGVVCPGLGRPPAGKCLFLGAYVVRRRSDTVPEFPQVQICRVKRPVGLLPANTLVTFHADQDVRLRSTFSEFGKCLRIGLG